VTLICSVGFAGSADKIRPCPINTLQIYLTGLRRLLRDLAPEGQPELILPEDFPPHLPTIPAYGSPVLSAAKLLSDVETGS
jgi:hypothetical protein